MISSLLTNEVTNFKGRYYELTDARCNPKPLQSHLPIVIGGKGPKRTLRTVARWADHWDVAGGPDVEEWKTLDATLRSHCEAIGRDQSADQAVGAHHVAGRRRSEGARGPGARRSVKPASISRSSRCAAPTRSGSIEPLADALRDLTDSPRFSRE